MPLTHQLVSHGGVLAKALALGNFSERTTPRRLRSTVTRTRPTVRYLAVIPLLDASGTDVRLVSPFFVRWRAQRSGAMSASLTTRPTGRCVCHCSVRQRAVCISRIERRQGCSFHPAPGLGATCPHRLGRMCKTNLLSSN